MNTIQQVEVIQKIVFYLTIEQPIILKVSINKQS